MSLGRGPTGVPESPLQQLQRERTQLRRMIQSKSIPTGIGRGVGSFSHRAVETPNNGPNVYSSQMLN